MKMLFRGSASVAVAVAIAAAGAGPLPAGAGEAGAVGESQRVEVKRQKIDEPDQPTLVFLKENRVFLRAELDRLRQLVKVTRDGSAELLDERLLRLREMAAAVAAARDTVGDAEAASAARDRLESVAEIANLEAQLDLMDSLLAAQKQRLAWLEADYLGQQRTALVVVVGGFAGREAPESVVLAEGDESRRVDFTPEQRTALAQGGVAQVHHAFVEPRTHEFRLAFEGGDWQEAPPALVSVETPRDRLTFLEIDLGGTDSGRNGGAPAAVVWQR